MRQLDDMMFITEKSRLRNAAIHFIKRCKGEKEIWAHDLKNLSERVLKIEPSPDGTLRLPDGTENKPIPFMLLRDEIELVRRTGKKFADYMLIFEKKVLQNELVVSHDGNSYNFQAWLKAQFKNPANQKYHFNFNAVLKLAGTFAETHTKILSEYRNITFHNDIPIGKHGSFSWLTRQGQPIRDLLQITEDLHAKKDRTAYLPGGEKHKV